MKFAGVLLLLAGWGIVLTAIILLTPGAARAAFVMAGVSVEAMGLVLLIRSHLFLQGDRG
jgi:hypothetical protein